MATRKIIQFGKNSFVVSLPKAWVERNKLGKGSEVNIDESPASLLLGPKTNEATSNLKIKKISCDDENNKISRSIISAYVNNYGIIEIYGQNLEKYTEEIETVTHSLVALEIMEQTPKKIIIKDFLNTQDISIENIIKRMDIIIRAMITEIFELFENGEKINLDKRDYDVNRLFYVGQKLINKLLDNPNLSKTLNMNIKETIFYFQLIDSLEKIADQQKRFVRSISSLDDNCVSKKPLKEAFDIVSKEYLTVIKALYKMDKNEADNILNSKIKILNKCEEIKDKYLNKCKGLENIHNTTEAIDKLKRFESCIAMIAKAMINKE